MYEVWFDLLLAQLPRGTVAVEDRGRHGARSRGTRGRDAWISGWIASGLPRSRDGTTSSRTRFTCRYRTGRWTRSSASTSCTIWRARAGSFTEAARVLRPGGRQAEQTPPGPVAISHRWYRSSTLLPSATSFAAASSIEILVGEVLLQDRRRDLALPLVEPVDLRYGATTRFLAEAVATSQPFSLVVIAGSAAALVLVGSSQSPLASLAWLAPLRKKEMNFSASLRVLAVGGDGQGLRAAPCSRGGALQRRAA